MSPTGIGRPKEGRRISGVAAGLARRFGQPVGRVRLVLVALALLGGALALACAIFDHRLNGGEPLGTAVRTTGIVLGLVGLLLYPALALVLRDERGPHQWDFGSSLGMILVLVGIGQAVGFLLEPYWALAQDGWQARGPVGLVTWIGDYVSGGVGGKDAVLVLFFLSATAFVVLQRVAVYRFFRAMHTGTSLVMLTTLAVAAGVAIPQIDGFEDPDQRVNLEKEREDFARFFTAQVPRTKLPRTEMDGHEQYAAFRWAEGYFIYHLLHLYGIGMPEAQLMPAMEQGLERFGQRYGLEEAANRRKEMTAAFSGMDKAEEIGAFVQRNENEFWRFFEVSTQLHLNRTYKSHWFAWLLVFLFVSVCLSAYKGRPRQWFSIQKIGFFVVHQGVMILLLGGLISNLFTDRGFLPMWLDRGASDTYLRHGDPSKRAKMPFYVRLDRFARQDWKALEVHFLDEEFTSNVPRYTLWPGRVIDLDYHRDADGEWVPRVRLEVKSLHERAEVVPRLDEASPGDPSATPVLELSLDAHDGHDHGATPMYLAPFLPPSVDHYVDPGMVFRLAPAFGPNPEELFPGEEGILGSLLVTLPGTLDAEVVPFRVGRTLTVGDYRITVKDATADFDRRWATKTAANHPAPLEEQPYRYAAVWLDVQPLDGGPVEENRVLVEHLDPVQQELQKEYDYDELVIRLDWDPWSAPGPPRYLIHWDVGRGPRLLGEHAEAPLPLEPGQMLPLPGGEPLRIVEAYENASFESELNFLPPRVHPDGWDEDFYAPDPKGLELDVVYDPDTERERRETVRLTTVDDETRSNLAYSEDGSMVLVFIENSAMLPFEWRSVLSILERDNAGNLYEVPLGTEQDREIRVNDYYYYKGYRFFQSGHDPEDPTYSGIGVVYDPGIEWVLVGMYTIIAGTAIAFLLRPMVLARRNAA